jgi:3-methyladenine DNA glycosylase Tag
MKRESTRQMERNKRLQVMKRSHWRILRRKIARNRKKAQAVRREAGQVQSLRTKLFEQGLLALMSAFSKKRRPE